MFVAKKVPPLTPVWSARIACALTVNPSVRRRTDLAPVRSNLLGDGNRE